LPQGKIAFGVTCTYFPDILLIFDMRFWRRLSPLILWTLALASATLRADPGDVESSHDYDGFPRLPGFVITDYDEDSPAEFDFPVARPLPDDANHIETVHVKGHRYVLRYELNPGNRAPGLFQTQHYYEKLAAQAGFTAVKTGAVGNVAETFYRGTATQQIWVYLEPAGTVNVLTVMEATGGASPPLFPHLVAAPPTTPAAPSPAVRAVYSPETLAEVGVSAPAPTPTPAPASLPTPTAPTPPAPTTPLVDPNDDSLYKELSENGRVVLPFVFQPSKDELDASSQPLVNRVVAMMKRHPDLFLRIEGHTDNIGDPDDNLRLSAQRAFAVQAMLIAADIDKKRLDAVGVGGLQPLADNDTAEGRQKNRRIELVMWKNGPAFHTATANSGGGSSSHSDTPVLNNDSTFHPPAPNGNNYYPDPGASSSN
jgi:outer membrane protein OmpA-like peptidoglycan-associated protein